jgi:hypothetical protein
LPKQALDLSGMTFGHLTVLHRVPGGKRVTFVCQCTCGITKAVRSEKLTDGLAKSCGCRRWSGKGDTLGIKESER